MAEESAESGGGEEKAPAPPKKPLNIGFLLGAANTVALLAVLGLLVFTKVLYKRPKITESVEREKIETEAKSAATTPEGAKVLIKLEPIQANLKPSQIGVQTPGGPPPQLKPHYLSMVIAFEIKDSNYEAAIRAQTPKFLDEVLQSLGNTTVEELSSVQGRFILRSKLMGIMNELVRKAKTDSPVVTNVFFSDFTVQ